MKNLKKILSLCLCLVMLVSCIPGVFAASVEEATIDMDAACSLTLWKYDWTNAHKDGVWDEDSFISTGWSESYVEDVLGNAVREGDADGEKGNELGNGQNSNGYAIKGVEYTYLKVADIVTFSESADDGHEGYNSTMVLYGFDKTKAADLLAAIGLADGEGRYENADNMRDPYPYQNAGDGSSNYWYYESDVLNDAIANALAENSTVLKDALEVYMKDRLGTPANGQQIDADADGLYDGGAMTYTDENGKTVANNLEVGLYLLVETEVPEMVTSTTDPFFVSLPMTTVSGNEHSASVEGGHEWNYDVVLYPKNQTGLITLEKTVRESYNDGGFNHHNGTQAPTAGAITDGYSHNATGSAGDVMDYQIITTLPTITSQATSLTTLNFYDTIGTGLVYNKGLRDVKIEFFTDAACTNRVASWDMDSGKFTVTYSDDGRHMTVDVTAAGFAEINGQTDNVNGELYVGYSNYTARVTYTATIVSSGDTTFGQDGNRNEVVLTWKRTSTSYYDTLIDDAHVYSFGIDLTKIFSDVDNEYATDQNMFEHVKFKVWNETDGYWVQAALNEDEGIYYVTEHVDSEEEATIFVPVTYDEDAEQPYGHIMIQGLEDDEYVITEIETANGYTLLKDDIHVVITSADDASRPCDIYSEDTLGLLQNDPHYTFNNGTEDLTLALIPQKQLAHNYLTASATVDGNDIIMNPDNYIDEGGDAAVSDNAFAPLTVRNTKGFNPPKTGDDSAQMLAMAGTVMLVATGSFLVLFMFKKNKKKEETETIR